MQIRLQLPEEGVLQPNDELHDPLRYYYRPIVGALYRGRIEQGLSLLDPPYAAILEIGYGSGLLIPTLAKIGKHVAGVDLASDPAKTRERLGSIGVEATLLKGDICKMDFPDGCFDLVVAFSVFEHIADPLPALATIHRLLKRGGSFLVGMPRVDRLMSKLFPLIGYKTIDEHHVTNPKAFLAAASEFFTLERTTQIPSFLPAFVGLYFNMLLRPKPMA